MSKKSTLTPIQQLAEYFTGSEVGINSIALAMPDGPLRMNTRAKKFFEVRSALGIEGYDEAQQAEEAILSAVAPAKPPDPMEAARGDALGALISVLQEIVACCDSPVEVRDKLLPFNLNTARALLATVTKGTNEH